MIQHSESVRIAASSQEVWGLVGDPTRWDQWAGEVGDVRVHGELAVGCAITYTYRGRPVEVTLSAYEDERLLEIRATEKSYVMREAIALDDEDGSTCATITMGFRPTAWWGKLVAPLLVPFRGLVLGRGMRGSLRALRRATEGV